MSLAHHHPRVIVNGTRRTRTFHYFWCQNCQRTTRFRSTDPSELFCPRCSGELYLELDISRPRRLFSTPARVESFPAPTGPLLDSLAFVLDTSSRPSRPITNDGGHNNLHSLISLHFDDEPSSRPVIENDQPGPPPAPVLTIEALKRVKISSETLLRNEVQYCPICKEELRFQVNDDDDEELITELPCKHLYHRDCIVPWLRLHNTCPVCRFELKDFISPAADHDHHHQPQQVFENGENNNNNTNDNYYRFEEEMANTIELWWSQLVGSRPFRILSEWSRRYFEFLYSWNNHNNTSQAAAHSWWRTWFIH